jgi:hypothetical protein
MAGSATPLATNFSACLFCRAGGRRFRTVQSRTREPIPTPCEAEGQYRLQRSLAATMASDAPPRCIVLAA